MTETDFENSRIHSVQPSILYGLYAFGQLMNGFGSGKKSTKFGPMNKPLYFLIVFFGLLHLTAFSQSLPFEQEVRQISARIDSLGWKKGGTVFTGSSTIRMWKSLQSSFPKENILNTGFGGSKASDLESHLFPLVIRLEPSRVFIYEGDNDLWSNVPVAAILTSLDAIVNRLQLIDPNMEIYLIGAKPSPSRWEKKLNYEIFNQKLNEYCLSKEKVEFVDTWKALTDGAGNPRPELFIQDQLHLNEKGYELWTEIFRSYFEN
ncbi:Lysophospholipase L1 [Algoriphagus alkaliphilus]|uniref:Lysophospholipase L1 n=1 Tax=Algoriphagus alkaliphilus TaxID=279824 RepID=A0A1G5XDP1_9BACT|nr:GDSL-type esterase/lipase family protein [Algoriphagus alkaliphilus]SDA68588.1 Lysophospholipase L1 [Algoriphagus alkaliphilus]